LGVFVVASFGARPPDLFHQNDLVETSFHLRLVEQVNTWEGALDFLTSELLPQLYNPKLLPGSGYPLQLVTGYQIRQVRVSSEQRHHDVLWSTPGACDASRALHARLLAAERQRTALLQALQSMVAAQPGAAAGAVDGAEVGATEAERLRAVSDAIAKLSDTRLSPAEVAAGLAELEQRDQLREADSASPPEWAGEEDTHADASLWRREEESRMLLEMSQGEEGGG
jgi:hypothetical protein